MLYLPFLDVVTFICQTYREIPDKGVVPGDRRPVLYVR